MNLQPVTSNNVTSGNDNANPHVNIRTNKLYEVDVEEDEYATGGEEDDEQTAYELPYRLERVHLRDVQRSDSIENNHFVDSSDNYNNGPDSKSAGNFYEYNFEDGTEQGELVEGDAGMTCLYNQVTSAVFRRENQQQQPLVQQQLQQQQQQLHRQQSYPPQGFIE